MLKAFLILSICGFICQVKSGAETILKKHETTHFKFLRTNEESLNRDILASDQQQNEFKLPESFSGHERRFKMKYLS